MCVAGEKVEVFFSRQKTTKCALGGVVSIPALGFFGGEKKVRQEKSYEKFYRENVPEKPLRTHHDKLSSIISDSSVATMGIFP
jgi:hypothetical protein